MENNKIIAGNKTIENASAIGLDDILIIETDGTKIIAVKRIDIDLDTKKGREMALADNATAKANIEWDIEAINEAWTVEEQAGWGIISEFETDPQEKNNFEEDRTLFIKITFEDISELKGMLKEIKNIATIYPTSNISISGYEV